ncbi:hypothetical protein L1987_05582 [Smallanthus sonchifolius]|uniref:Uncharacterized protein n=1 Tax=Smallanthus sonchifolius TaxID=185202 RepID=A0ACB9JW11_9ASTR|nr:hypothetical protein L1987_05582 [Smallanthus sonchifolius]
MAAVFVLAFRIRVAGGGCRSYCGGPSTTNDGDGFGVVVGNGIGANSAVDGDRFGAGWKGGLGGWYLWVGVGAAVETGGDVFWLWSTLAEIARNLAKIYSLEGGVRIGFVTVIHG